MENKECCKWCDHCLITNLDAGHGSCDWDIGEHVNILTDVCSAYCYDDNLDRC